MRKSKAGYGIMILSALLGAAGATCYKELSFSLSPEMLTFLARLFPLIVLFPAALHAKGRDFRTKHLPLLVLSSFFYFLAAYGYIVALKYIPIVSVSLLYNCAPLWTPFIEWMWLKDPIHKYVWIGIAISCLGILFVIQPGLAMFHPIAFVAMLAGVSMAFSFVANRKLARTESAHKIVSYNIVFSALFSLVPVFVTGLSWPYTLKQSLFPIFLLVLSGLLAYSFQFLRAKAVSLLSAARAMPFSFFGPVFAGVFGWIFFDNIPNLIFCIGAIVVIGGMILILRAEY